MIIQINNVETRFLNLIAGVYSIFNKTPINYLFPKTSDPYISKMTVLELVHFQNTRLNLGYKSSMVGKYAMSVRDIKNSVISLKLNANTIRHTEEIQDILYLQFIKTRTRFNEWITSNITNVEFISDLSKVCPRVPVPTQVQGKFRVVNAGKSFFDNETDIETVDLGWIIEKISEIQNTVNSMTIGKMVDVGEGSPNAAFNPVGKTITDSMKNFAYNGQYSPDKTKTTEVRNPISASVGYQIPGINVDINDDVQVSAVIKNRVRILYETFSYGDNIVPREEPSPIVISTKFPDDKSKKSLPRFER